MADRPRGTKHRHRIRSRHAVVAGVAAAGLLLAACGGGGSGVAALEGGDASADDGSTDVAATEEAMLEYTECLREHGVNVGDPVVDADGNVGFGGIRVDAGEEEGDLGQARGNFQAAREACGEPPGGGFAERDEAEVAEMQDAALELAQCMRDNGIDFPDPNFDGGAVQFGGPGGPGGNLDPNDPAFQAAMDKCQEIVGGFQRGGPQGQVGSG